MVTMQVEAGKHCSSKTMVLYKFFNKLYAIMLYQRRTKHVLYDSSEFENEIHFLFYSPLQNNFRYQLFSKTPSNCPDSFSMSD